MKLVYILTLLTITNASLLQAMKKDNSKPKLGWGEQMDLIAPLDFSKKKSVSWSEVAQGAKPSEALESLPVTSSPQTAASIDGSRKYFHPHRKLVWRADQAKTEEQVPQPQEVTQAPSARKPITLSAVTTSNFTPRFIEQSQASQKGELYNPQLTAQVISSQKQSESNREDVDASQTMNMHYMQRIISQLREHAQTMQSNQDKLLHEAKNTSRKYDLLKEEHTKLSKLLELVIAQNALQMQTLDALAARFGVAAPSSHDITQERASSDNRLPFYE